MFSFELDTKETSTEERRGSPKGTDFEMANGRFGQQISAIVTRCLLLRSAHQKRMMWPRPRSRMLFCNVVSGWEDAEWKRNFRIGRPTTSLCFFRAFIFSPTSLCFFRAFIFSPTSLCFFRAFIFSPTSLCFFRAFIFSRHCVNVRLYPAFSSSPEIFRYDTSFLVIPRSCACIPPSLHNSSSFALSLSQVHPRSAIFNPLFALKPVSNPSPDEGRTRMLNPGSTSSSAVADLGGFQRFPLKPPLANSIIEIH